MTAEEQQTPIASLDDSEACPTYTPEAAAAPNLKPNNPGGGGGPTDIPGTIAYTH